MSFPKGFLIGASTAAHQVEGNNIHSDYWAQEQLPHSSFTEPSGLACDHYNRYEEDIRLMAQAGLNAYRFSIEWARIEPEEGCFSEDAIEHYRKVIRCCRENGVEPMVTLMHFTSPVWLIQKGGWEAESTIEYFRRYAAYVTEKLGDEIKYICTINEANMGLQLAAISKRFQMMAQQAQKNAQKAEGTVQVGMNFQKMMENMKYAAQENAAVFGTPQPQIFVSSRTPEGDALVFRAHQAAKEAIKAIHPEIQVGITLSLHDLQALPGGEAFAENAWDEEFRHYLSFIQGDDFLGVQNYTRTQYGPEGFPGNLIVTENGIATSDDTRRVEFIRRALQGVENCLNDGIPVKGYCHWSLMDNFEWQKGYSMTFGLIAVDRTTQERKPKESLKYLGSFAQ